MSEENQGNLEETLKKAQELAESSDRDELEEAVEIYKNVIGEYLSKQNEEQAKICATEAISVCMKLDNGTYYWLKQAVNIARDTGLDEPFVRIGIDLIKRYENIGGAMRMGWAEELKAEIEPKLHLVIDVEQHIKFYEAELNRVPENDLGTRLQISIELCKLANMGGYQEQASQYRGMVIELVDRYTGCKQKHDQEKKILKPGDPEFDRGMKELRGGRKI